MLLDSHSQDFIGMDTQTALLFYTVTYQTCIVVLIFSKDDKSQPSPASAEHSCLELTKIL